MSKKSDQDLNRFLNVGNLIDEILVLSLMTLYKDYPHVYFTIGFFNAIRVGQVISGEANFVLSVRDLTEMIKIALFGYLVYFPLNYVFGLL